MEQVTQGEAMVCEVCGTPLTDGGVDYYCATKGCEDEHTLKNAVLASMRNDRKATRTNDQAKDEEIARLKGRYSDLADEVEFLLDRLDECERDFADDDATNYYHGHCDPPKARLRAILESAA